MDYAPAKEECPLPYSPFKSCVVPRPIGWLSTISKDGIDNLAPFGQWQNLTFDPPMVMFAAHRHADGRRKDTVINVEETGWFVWNMATYKLREAVKISGMAVPSTVDEFDHAKVTKAPCVDAPGHRVAESPCHMECSFHSMHTIEGDSPAGTVDIIYGKVERIHVDDDVILFNGKLDIKKIQPLARLGYFDYAVIEDTFEMRVPGGSDVAARGFEGIGTPDLVKG